MIPHEACILPHSHYYLYTPSADAMRTFLFPTCAGRFFYAPGYRLHRSSYDSILIMLVESGSCCLETPDTTAMVRDGEIAFVNCYESHGYHTDEGWEGLWLHFDGPTARAYYDLVYRLHGSVIRLSDTRKAKALLLDIFRQMQQHTALKEALVNRQIIELLTLFLTESPKILPPEKEDIIEEAAAYLRKHITQDITLEELAARSYLSPYYFLRLFKKKTGYTPHEYLIATRIGAARFLLKTTQMPLKDICLACGFHSMAAFCTTFKKWEGKTPTRFRQEE